MNDRETTPKTAVLDNTQRQLKTLWKTEGNKDTSRRIWIQHVILTCGIFKMHKKKAQSLTIIHSHNIFNNNILTRQYSESIHKEGIPPKVGLTFRLHPSS